MNIETNTIYITPLANYRFSFFISMNRNILHAIESGYNIINTYSDQRSTNRNHPLLF